MGAEVEDMKGVKIMTGIRGMKNGGRKDRRVSPNGYYGHYGYRERVYPSPRVIYAPPSSRGIGIFFPPVYIRY
jgi:hypothetical protein